MFGAIDMCSKYAWVVPLKDKIFFTITNPFQKFLDEPNCSVANSEERKPNFPFYVLANFSFLLSVFLLHFKQ